MKRTFLILAAASALIAPAAIQAKPRLTPQQQLDKLLEGRVAGTPVSCISSFNTRDMQIIDKTAIVYNSGNIIYVNKTTNTESLDSDSILVTTLHGSELCSVDTIQLHDRSDGFWRGFVGLDKFVPYKRVPKGG